MVRPVKKSLFRTWIRFNYSSIPLCYFFYYITDRVSVIPHQNHIFCWSVYLHPVQVYIGRNLTRVNCWIRRPVLRSQKPHLLSSHCQEECTSSHFRLNLLVCFCKIQHRTDSGCIIKCTVVNGIPFNRKRYTKMIMMSSEHKVLLF